MAKKIVWSRKAQSDRKEIFEYWNTRNKSSNYSRKLNTLFKEAIQVLLVHYEIGKLTEVSGVRAKIVRDYFIFYEVINEELHILSIWDSRQDPHKNRHH